MSAPFAEDILDAINDTAGDIAIIAAQLNDERLKEAADKLLKQLEDYDRETGSLNFDPDFDLEDSAH